MYPNLFIDNYTWKNILKRERRLAVLTRKCLGGRNCVNPGRAGEIIEMQ